MFSGEGVMTRKRFSEEDALDILRQIDLDLASGSTVETSRSASSA